jgi:uncharacterized membrane protein YqjE
VAGGPEKSYGGMAIELFDAMRIARATGGLLLEHLVVAAELLHLEWQEEKARLKQLILINLLGAIFVALVLLHGSALAIALVWNTPYRLQGILAMLLLFVIGICLCWIRLQRLSDRTEQQFAESRAQIGKTIDLLKRHL